MELTLNPEAKRAIVELVAKTRRQIERATARLEDLKFQNEKYTAILDYLNRTEGEK